MSLPHVEERWLRNSRKGIHHSSWGQGPCNSGNWIKIQQFFNHAFNNSGIIQQVIIAAVLIIWTSVGNPCSHLRGELSVAKHYDWVLPYCPPRWASYLPRRNHPTLPEPSWRTAQNPDSPPLVEDLSHKHNSMVGRNKLYYKSFLNAI